MAANDSTTLEVRRRDTGSSRDARRLRREGRVPGVLYGLNAEPIPFEADERELRHALHGHGAVLDLVLDDGSGEPAVLKDAQRHPVRGDLMHVDLVRVDLKKPIEAQVPVHIVGAEESPGVREGGVLEHPTREVTVEALPAAIPEYLEVSVTEMEINERADASVIALPDGVTLISDSGEVVAQISPPRLQVEEEEIEGETELVGEGEEGEAAEEDGDDAGDSDSDSDSDE